MTRTNSWFRNPSKRQVSIITVVWLIGVTLLTAGVTDLYKESIFQMPGTIKTLIAGSAFAVLGAYVRYAKSKKDH